MVCFANDNYFKKQQEEKKIKCKLFLRIKNYSQSV